MGRLKTPVPHNVIELQLRPLLGDISVANRLREAAVLIRERPRRRTDAELAFPLQWLIHDPFSAQELYFVSTCEASL
ncbi:hypothetical protein NDU88_008224 [Pleurodeles waltl]|uniref:Uncharacterized protein n=1 Tax=Pleurodeles waltl TaxID=8319 RepID=A0AAV7NX85_PLEWA|nr:hypothetical protein NDU88_008224 [Pleurodeles waltl]